MCSNAPSKFISTAINQLRQQQHHQQQQPQHQHLASLIATTGRASWNMFNSAAALSSPNRESTSPPLQPLNEQQNDNTTDNGPDQEDARLPPVYHQQPDGMNPQSASAMGDGMAQGSESDGSGSVHSKKRRRRGSVDRTARTGGDPSSTEKGYKKSFVEHSYHDHSMSPPPGDMESKTKGRGGITTPFPVQLHEMLQHAQPRGYDSIVNWQPHGRAFRVIDQKRFVEEVMPMFFRQTRMSSFQRQLSLYGFLRLTKKNADHGAYYHELFLRGMPHLCHRMNRTRVKGYWVRQSSSPESEPDFSTMRPVGVPGEDGTPSAAAVAAVPPVAARAARWDSSLWQLVEDGAARGYSAGEQSEPLRRAKLPPMPPLSQAVEIPIYGPGGLKQAPSTDQITAQTMMEHVLPIPDGPFHQQRRPYDMNYRLHAAGASQPQEVAAYEAELEEHVKNMSAGERDDMKEFLSDVDLTSGDENSVEECFEEEAKIARVASSSSLKKNKRRRLSSM